MTRFSMLRGAILAGLAGAVMAMPASAAVYTYTMNTGAVLTINSSTSTGTMVGNGISATFKSADFAKFKGGERPNFMATLTSLTGSRAVDGVTYVPDLSDTSHPPILKLGAPAGGAGNVNLWAIWSNGCGDTLGDYLATSKNYTPPPRPRDVPAPAMPILLGLGALGFAYRARRIQARPLATA